MLGRASLNAQGAGASFSCNFTDTIVDTETGKVDVLSFPSYVEGQMQGGAVQGIGWALNEEYIYDEIGVMENPGFQDYRVPVASDMPMIDTEIIEVPNPFHPYGVRGVGGNPDRGTAGSRIERGPRPVGVPHSGPAAVAAEGAGGHRRPGGRRARQWDRTYVTTCTPTEHFVDPTDEFADC